MQSGDQRPEFRDFACFGQRRLKDLIMCWSGSFEQLPTSIGEFGVDAPTVVIAEDPRQQSTVLQTGDETRRSTARQCCRTSQLPHAHVPAVLPAERIQNSEFNDRKLMLTLE